jgi:histidine triad (HIT) family protein
VSACAFCEILDGHRPADIVLDEAEAAAFLDHRPLFPGHVLVVPRRHVSTIEDVGPELQAPLFDAVRRTSAAVRTALGAEGSFVAANNRVSQSVPHLHVHVVPRSRGDGLRGFFWPRRPYDDDAHRGAIAAAIRSAFDAAGP